ncbi:hypothetical protein LOTGIDRAFT_175026 [Lottia gigantea]|uniref:Uncharacterized protein n=1 Tax=Lottia gigantea TaxID=225164 RepID=V4AMG3_LOTGI|nr:hypothetical protein LOTGIDRAFT_175026 [Lottia gigantea]ESO95945.1 hypothetical protein LOTGIDRAFT_175026 [Lottia gigantea]
MSSDDSLRSSLMIRNDKSEANSDFVRDENVVAEIGSENKSDATQNCPKHKASKTTNNKVRTRDRISNLESKLDKFLEVFDQRSFIAPTFEAAFEKHRKIDKSQRFDQTRPIRDKSQRFEQTIVDQSQRLDNYNNAYQDEASAKRAKFKNYKSIISSSEEDDVLSLQPGQSEINCFSSDYAQSDENNCMPVLEKEVVPSTKESNVNVTDKSLFDIFDIFGKDALNLSEESVLINYASLWPSQTQHLLPDFQARKRKSSVVQQPEPIKRGRLSYKPYEPANYNTSSNYSFRAKRFTERYQDKKPYTRGYDRKPNFKSGKAYRPNKKSNE